MKTENLISLLSTGVEPADRYALTKRFGLAMLAAACGSTILMAVVYGVRTDINQIWTTPLFLAKVAFPLSLAVISLVVTAHLSRPGAVVGVAGKALAVPFLAAWSAALVLLWSASPDTRVSLLMGVTWRTCAFNIALLSLPSFIAVFWAIKGLAPTRLRVAGAAGGLLAGSTATVAYCLHCPEMAVPFWAGWYVLGMSIPTAIGALLGPRILRW
jgi:hypothetical protein